MKGNQIPKALRVKGKSNYLFIRLRQEKLKNINQLWERYYPTTLTGMLKKFFRDLFKYIFNK